MLLQGFDVICDDSEPMEPHPPLSDEEKKREDEFWARIEAKYLK